MIYCLNNQYVIYLAMWYICMA